MPNFVYEALNEAGKRQKGSIQAASSEDAIARIRSKGYFPTSVREQKAGAKKGPSTAKSAEGGEKKKKDFVISIGGVNQKALTTFTRQLSTLQDAGLPILRSLQVLSEQQKPGLFRNILTEVREDVSGGATLSDAMAKHPKAFNKLYAKMIAAGEVGGVLDVILQRLADFMEKAAKLKAKIKGAMVYPTVVILVALSIVLAIMIFIVPKFQEIFEDFDSELPDLTKFLMLCSGWLIGDGYTGQVIPGILWILLTPVFVVFGLKLFRKSHFGKASTDTVIIKVPIVGPLMTKSIIAKFTRTLGTLVNAGVPILDAIIITRDTSGNYVFEKALTNVHDSVRQGDSFSEPLRVAKVCDPIVVNMIEVGEETGDLDKMLDKVANTYDEEVDQMVANLVSLLEPVMVVMLGLIVGFIVVALFLPLVKLIQSVA